MLSRSANRKFNRTHLTTIVATPEKVHFHSVLYLNTSLRCIRDESFAVYRTAVAFITRLRRQRALQTVACSPGSGILSNSISVMLSG